jgi:hypothetical protein
MELRTWPVFKPNHSDLIAPLTWLAFFKETNNGLSYKSFSLEELKECMH